MEETVFGNTNGRWEDDDKSFGFDIKFPGDSRRAE